jgi:hypothetical protein
MPKLYPHCHCPPNGANSLKEAIARKERNAVNIMKGTQGIFSASLSSVALNTILSSIRDVEV